MFRFKLPVVPCVLTTLYLLYHCRGETMTASIPASAAVAVSTNNVFDVKVGNMKAELVFEPDTVMASVGDIINFHFYPFNHSVAQSSFEKPCQPLSGGVGQMAIFSGFIPVNSGESVSSWMFPRLDGVGRLTWGSLWKPFMFSMTINSTDPMWLYCSQTYASHCQAGQVMVINPLSSSSHGTSQTLEEYKAAAKNATTSTSPAEVYGGVVIANVGIYNITASCSDTSTLTSTTSASKCTPAKGLALLSRSASKMVIVGASFLAVGRAVFWGL